MTSRYMLLGTLFMTMLAATLVLNAEVFTDLMSPVATSLSHDTSLTKTIAFYTALNTYYAQHAADLSAFFADATTTAQTKIQTIVSNIQNRIQEANASFAAPEKQGQTSVEVAARDATKANYKTVATQFWNNYKAYSSKFPQPAGI